MLAWGQGRCEVPTPGLGSRLRPGWEAFSSQAAHLTQAGPYLIRGQPLALTECLQKLRDLPGGEGG